MMEPSRDVDKTLAMDIKCTAGYSTEWQLYGPGDLIPAVLVVQKYRSCEVLSLHGSFLGTFFYG